SVRPGIELDFRRKRMKLQLKAEAALILVRHPADLRPRRLQAPMSHHAAAKPALKLSTGALAASNNRRNPGEETFSMCVQRLYKRGRHSKGRLGSRAADTPLPGEG
ncbi:MAG TPA: hypothetical protein VFF88_08360, partial [Methylocella sp.]|nr:hypothetical protein [Methylocella sp.]